MESFTDYMDCSRCGKQAYQEFILETGEESIQCPHCGYYRKFVITNKDNMRMDEWGELPMFSIDEGGGFGAYKVRHKNSIGHEIGSFTEPASEQEFIRLIEENRDQVEHAEYTTFVDGELVNVVLILGDVESHGEEIPAHIEQ